MSFAELNIIFLAVAAVVFAGGLWRSRPGGTRGALLGVASALVVLIILTAVFDNIMIASGLFDYGGHTLNGLYLGLAPIEDFAYPLGAALLLPGLWLLFTGKADQ